MTTFTVSDQGTKLTGDVSSGLVGAAVKLRLRRPDGTIEEVTATVIDQVEGVWEYVWPAGKLDQAGRWWVKAVVTYQVGAIETFGPNSFDVDEQYVPA